MKIAKEVEILIHSYPLDIQKKIFFLRKLIIEVAKEEKILLLESLKWNEPSYTCKNGTSIRIAWKKKSKNNYSMYFSCQTKLIKTFRELFDDIFIFEGNREICFSLAKNPSIKELKYCILLALQYHKRKHLHMLDE